MTILPGNKYMVLGTKEGVLMLYDINSQTVINRFKAHQKEIWEISYHSEP